MFIWNLQNHCLDVILYMLHKLIKVQKWWLRPLPSVGVFQFRLGENDKIYFCQDKYQERIVSPKHPLAKVFEDSNMQPVSDVFDIVAVDSICGRYVIDLTDVLTKGRKWAQVKFPQLRRPDGYGVD